MEILTQHGTLTALVVAAAERHLDAIAVQDGEVAVSYRDLLRRARDLARRVRKACDLAPGCTVAISLPRSIELVVAELATLLAPSAFLALDQDEPEGRRTRMLADAGAVAIIDADGVRALSRESGRASPLGAEESAAYITFTSGSTGVPKGVVTEHRAIRNYVLAAIANYELTCGDTQLMFSSPGFDISLEEIFTTLAAGARLVVRPPELIGVADLLLWCERTGVTVLNLPTGVWRDFAAGLDAQPHIGLPDTLRLVIIGGERATESARDSWFAAARGPLRVVNTYGPTEAAIAVSMADLRPGEPISIGRAIRGVTLFPAAGDLQPVSAGETGELLIGGVAPARCYLADAELTTSRFPVREDGARFYRTGDLGRVQPDGTIEFLGRCDSQVKVRGGYRVQPEEVTATIRSIEGINDAVVLPRAKDASTTLAAFVVLDGHASYDEGALRRELLSRLPNHMVPSSIAVLDRFPLTGRGKIDHDALLANAAVSSNGVQERLTLADDGDPYGAAVAEAWREVLGVAPLADDESFFEAGGDSLGAVELVSTLETMLGCAPDLGTFFRAPTPAALRAYLSSVRDSADPAC